MENIWGILVFVCTVHQKAAWRGVQLGCFWPVVAGFDSFVVREWFLWSVAIKAMLDPGRGVLVSLHSQIVLISSLARSPTTFEQSDLWARFLPEAWAPEKRSSTMPGLRVFLLYPVFPQIWRNVETAVVQRKQHWPQNPSTWVDTWVLTLWPAGTWGILFLFQFPSPPYFMG